MSAPSGPSGTVLPNTDLVFTIPTVGAPASATLAVLPNTDFAFNIPEVAISTNASSTVPDLPNTDSVNNGFDIPDLAALNLVPTTPTTTREFPNSTTTFAIPDLVSLGLVPSAPSGVPNLPSVASHFVTSTTIRGMGTEDNDFWIITNGTGLSGVDQIQKITDGATSTLATIDGPSSSLEGVAFLNGFLWVLENLFRCGDTVDTSCDRQHRVFKVDPASPPTGTSTAAIEASWGSLATVSAPEAFAEITGIAPEGSGATASLWLTRKDLFKFYNISLAGSELSSPSTDSFVDGVQALAFNDDALYTAKGDTITQWTTEGRKVTEFITSLTGVSGLTFKDDVLYMAHPSGSNGEVSKGFVPINVTNDPRGITFSPSTAAVGEALWILTDAGPKDKLLKVDTTGNLISSFGTSGFVEAPSGDTEGITFLDGFLWIVANEDFTAKLYKVDATSGAVLSTFNLDFTASIFGDIGGITNNGTDLYIHDKSFNDIFILSTANAQKTGDEQVFPCCPSNSGARGFAYNSSRNQFFSAKNTRVTIYDSELQFVAENDVIQTGGSISGIQGMAFDGNLLYIAHTGSGTVSSSFLATDVTTKPRGLTFTSSSSAPGEALWVLVDATPFDKILKIDPINGTLISEFGTNGFVDAPSSDTEGITFLDTGTPSTSFLWVVANESFQRRLFKINASTGALVTSYDLGARANIFDNLGGITTDGTNLVVYFKPFNDIVALDPSDVSEVERTFLCCPNVFGSKSFAYHSGRDQYFAAKNDTLLTIDSGRQFAEQERTLLLDGIAFTGTVEGLTIDQDVVYVARTEGGVGKISVGALRQSVETNPKGIALSPSGSSLSGSPIGRALWVLVDGDPADVVLKLDPDTTGTTTATLLASFDAPNNRTEGITFLDNHLWIVAEDGFNQSLFKVNPVTGAKVSTFNLSGFPSGFVFDTLGGITNDQTDLLAMIKSFNDLFKIDTTGQKVDLNFLCCPLVEGTRGLAFRTANGQLLTGKGSDIIQYASESGGQFFVAAEFDVSGSVTGIEGLTIDPGLTTDPEDDLVYIVHGGSGKISTATLPSEVSNTPLGLTYDGSTDELYILVDGTGENPDHVIVVDPAATSTPTVIRDFPAPSSDAEAITILDSQLYVSAVETEFCCPPPRVYKLASTTGAVLDSFEIFDFFNDITGLSNDGIDLLAFQQGAGPLVHFLDPADGDLSDDVFFFDPSNPNFFEDGYDALAFDTTTEQFYPMVDEDVFRFNEEGQLIESFTIAGVNDIQGATFVGELLYLAEAQGDTIRSAAVPQPAVTITKNPRGMATDGESLFLVVDATPVDKIMKIATTTGALVSSFGDGGQVDSPGGETASLVYHNGHLYTVTNDLRNIPNDFGGFIQRAIPVLFQLATTTGEELAHFPIPLAPEDGGQSIFGQTFLFDTVGALASDGQFLYIGVQGTEGIVGSWLKFDPDLQFVNAQRIDQFAGTLAFLDGFESFETTLGPQFLQNRQFLASGDTGSGSNNVISRFDRDTGVMFDQHVLTATSTTPDIEGMAYIGLILYMADDATDNILGIALPESTVEITIVGSYTSQASVTTTAGSDTSDAVPFTVVRNPDVVVELTSPQDSFVVTDPTQNIVGLVNDPAVTQVDVGIQLPFTSLVDDQVSASSVDIWDVTNRLGGSAVWHVACDNASPGFPSTPRYSSSPCSWRYATPDGPNFDTGAQTAGTLKTKDPITVTTGMKLRFSTGYITEPVPDADIKTVDVAIVTLDPQGNDLVGPFKPVAQIVGPGFAGEPPPSDAHSGFTFIQLEPLFINPNLAQVVIDLSQFDGQRVLAQFRFDSVDVFANQSEGWYVDDITIEGAAFQVVQATTTPLSTPQDIGGETFFQTFSVDNFILAEGQNDVRAEATQPYSPFLKGLDSVSGFVDTIAPVINLSGIAGTTNLAAQTLTGFVGDTTFQSVEITQTTASTTQVIFGLGSLPLGGNFSLPVSLIEGSNTFTAVATDQGNATSSAALVTILDTAPPTIANDGTIFPVGAVSARPDDELIFQVTADDSTGDVSGVQKVELVIDGQVIDDLTLASDLPAIIREQFDITGDWVLFTTVPSGIPPGEFVVTLRATDFAGNSSETTVSGDVTAALEAMNVFLFNGANLVGVNLQARGGSPDFDIEDVLVQLLDSSRLDPGFESGLLSVLGSTSASSSGSLIGASVLPVLSTTGFEAGDRVAIGSGDTELTSNASAGVSTLSVDSTAGFAVGQVIAVTGEQGAFGLGFTAGVETTTIASIVDGSTLTLSVPLAESHFDGARVTGVQRERVVSVDGTGSTLTIGGVLVVGPATGAVQVQEEVKLGDIIDAIFHFTGGLSVGPGSTEGVFQQFVPGVGGNLTGLSQGRGYWFITNADAFDRSEPLPGFLQGPIIPIRMQLDGVLFDAAGTPPSLPSTVELDKSGWFQIALIAERERPVEQGVRGLLSPIRVFTSLIEFQKFIGFDSSSGEVEIVGGVFNPLFAGDIANPGDAMEIGRGFYVFQTQQGTHTP